MATDGSRSLFQLIDQATYSNERDILNELVELSGLSEQDRKRISQRGASLVEDIRGQSSPGLMEVFLAEYGLSTDEGIALMCLAEALLRVPDSETMDALIEDKIASSDWAGHLGQSTSPLVNASTWALMLTGKVLQEQSSGPVSHLRGAVKRLGEPVIRSAVNRAMKEMGRQFVLGETIQAAMQRAHKQEVKGYTYSYDMLGEAVLTNDDAERCHLAYSRAISAIATACQGRDIRTNPGISVKLSALFPRYEVAQRTRVLNELVPRIASLALLAKSAGMGLTIDAEEADRLSLSLEVIEKVLSEPTLAGWDGFGVVVQAYGQRAGLVIDSLYQMIKRLDRRITIRLVKGAYWDAEIKQAQVKGLEGFPVFTSKAATDVSYIANAKRLLGMTDRIYPQFATHNAHTIAAILHMADDKSAYEFQRLHGMGEQLHSIVKAQENVRCRIYAPVGAHQDLLAYLVRRLLENGANSSFVNQITDTDVSADTIAADPFLQITTQQTSSFATGTGLFQPERLNSKGWDLTHRPTLQWVDQAREPFFSTQWQAQSITVEAREGERQRLDVRSPSNYSDLLGTVVYANEAEVQQAASNAQCWHEGVHTRAQVLNRIADLYEENFGELFAILAREAGKTLPDAVAELREAVDFLRYYAANAIDGEAVGTFVCISPWNFPLAIFTGQIAAALAAGNAVLAKPAEQTPAIAWRAVQLMHEAGVPTGSLQLLLGNGVVGAHLTKNPSVDGVIFTGSTQTAQIIRRSMAQYLKPGAPFVAETGGLNAMIVDSTALPEQAVRAVVESAFQSAGQRCSALRCLYVQEDVVEEFKEMLFGAMDEIQLNDPWQLSTDSGPVIDQDAMNTIVDHINFAKKQGRLLKQVSCPEQGFFVAPSVISIDGIKEIEQEVFGPVLHLATFRNDQLNEIIDDINATGYGLTFGLQTRIDDRVQSVCEKIQAGNVYVNRNQIGAIVGSQPFGGNGLSGTGPKAGGPHYLSRFYKSAVPTSEAENDTLCSMSVEDIQGKIDAVKPDSFMDALNLPGPTGESNRLSFKSRAPLLCLGPGLPLAREQADIVTKLGGTAVVCGGALQEQTLLALQSFSGLIWWGSDSLARKLDQVLASMNGPLLPLITGKPDTGHVVLEQHVCVDTTASGGNTELLSGGDHTPQSN
jgi:RHH-type proline utilization regulon transcriptional repressor/proline dehydrogenase/delta 1-pyrroline-5-carboxylate dehydrogenase